MQFSLHPPKVNVEYDGKCTRNKGNLENYSIIEHLKAVSTQKLNTYSLPRDVLQRIYLCPYKIQHFIFSESPMKAQVLHKYDDDLTAPT